MSYGSEPAAAVWLHRTRESVDAGRRCVARRTCCLIACELRKSAIFACVQVTLPTTEQLAEDLLGFVAYLTKTTEQGVLQVAAELELTLSQLRALFELAVADHDLALGELAAKIGLSVAATGRLVDGLVHHDLVSRREDPVDRRVKRLALTARGDETMARLAEARRQDLRQFVETLGDDTRRALALALAATPNLSRRRSAGTETEAI
jgi:DNA-binding MarR family transcriptional regulator